MFIYRLYNIIFNHRILNVFCDGPLSKFTTFRVRRENQPDHDNGLTPQSCNSFIKASLPDKSVVKIIFFFPNLNICCGYSKEPSHRAGSFQHPKYMF